MTTASYSVCRVSEDSGGAEFIPTPPNRPLLLKTQTNSPGGVSNRPRGHLKRERERKRKREGCMAELYVSGTAQLHYVYPAVRLWALIMQRVSLLSAIETHSGLARAAHCQGQRGNGMPALQMEGLDSSLLFVSLLTCL